MKCAERKEQRAFPKHCVTCPHISSCVFSNSLLVVAFPFRSDDVRIDVEKFLKRVFLVASFLSLLLLLVVVLFLCWSPPSPLLASFRFVLVEHIIDLPSSSVSSSSVTLLLSSSSSSSSSSSIPLGAALSFARVVQHLQSAPSSTSSSSKVMVHSGALSATPPRYRRDYFATSLMTPSSSSRRRRRHRCNKRLVRRHPPPVCSVAIVARCRYLLLGKTFPIRVTTQKQFRVSKSETKP